MVKLAPKRVSFGVFVYFEAIQFFSKMDDETVMLAYFLRYFVGGKCHHMGRMGLQKLQMEGIS